MLRIILQHFAVLLIGIFPSSTIAEVLQFDKVTFVEENNSGSSGGWTQLKFRVDGPRVGSERYRDVISFTIDTDRTTSFDRTDIRFKEDWLDKRWYQSSSSMEEYLGSGKLSSKQQREILLLSPIQKSLLAWIVTNSDELIDFALESKRGMNPKSRKQWQRMTQNHLFENNVRKNFGRIPSVQSEIRARDKYARHTPTLLKNRIQLPLKKLGYYDGEIDGLIGPGTIRAIKQFERQAGLFPDGVLRTGRELVVLDKALKATLIDDVKDQPKRPPTTARFSSLNGLAQDIRIANVSIASFPNDGDNRLTDIILEPSFRWQNRWHELKINGHYNKSANKYEAGDLCVVTHNQSDKAVCINYTFNFDARKILQNYIDAAPESTVDLTYLKCAIVWYRYNNLYDETKSNSFIRGLYKEYRDAYLSVAGKCMDTIIASETQSRVNPPENVDELQKQISALKKALENTRSVSAKRLSVIKEQREKLKAASRDNSSDNEIRVLENRLAGALARLAAEELKLRQYKAEVAPQLVNADATRSKLQAAQNTIDVLEISLEDQLRQIEILEGKIAQNSGLDTQNVDLRKQLAATVKEKQLLNNINAGLNSALEVAELKLEENLEDLTQKEAEVTALSSQLVAAQSAVVTHSSTIDDLKNRLKNEVIEKQSAIELLMNARNQIESLVGELEAAQNQIESLTAELKAALAQKAVETSEPEGFQLSAEWDAYKQWITPSQMRFCNILHEYEIARNEAANSGNQLLQNMAIKQRDRDITALLTSSRNGPSGFRNWVSVVQSVFAMDSLNPATGQVELAAGVILDTPCGISVGTGRVLDKANSTKSEFKYLAFENDLIFSQLASVRRGDPVLFDGSFAKAENGGAEMFITNELGEEEKIEAYEKPEDAPDMFVDITYLAKL